MLSIDFKNWNSLRDFIESKENVYIDLTTHIDFLVLRAKKILRAEFENGDVVITKDNIHLYYEFMSDEDIENNIYIISRILYTRYTKVGKELFLFNVNFDEKAKYVFVSRLKNVFATVVSFGIKDTLKPIDEYIAEIKSSKEYQEYISSKLA